MTSEKTNEERVLQISLKLMSSASLFDFLLLFLVPFLSSPSPSLYLFPYEWSCGYSTRPVWALRMYRRSLSLILTSLILASRRFISPVCCVCIFVSALSAHDVLLLFFSFTYTSLKNQIYYLSHQIPTARCHATCTIALARHAIHTQIVPRFGSHERPTAPSSGNSLAPSSTSWSERP